MSSHRPKQIAASPSPCGFTLVELLVALFVMSIMAVLAWQGLAGILRARETSQAQLERSSRMQTVLAQWEQDLLALHDSRIVPPIRFDGATLRLTRRTEAGVQIVAWSLRGRALWRWAAAPTVRAVELQQSWLASQQLLGGEPAQLKMLDGTSAWQLYFFRDNAWTNAQSSADLTLVAPVAPAASAASAPAVAREKLPSGVRAVITFDGNETTTLTRDIVLAPQP